MKSTFFIIAAFLGVALAETSSAIVTVVTTAPISKPTDTPGCHSGGCGGHCGDGLVQPPEACDLGTVENHRPGSGCTPTCTIEPYCGDGLVNTPGEQCDLGKDRNGKPGEKCTIDCKNCDVGYCGDGIVQPGLNETCDLGRLLNGAYNSPCSSNCQPCSYCGDSHVDAGEDCDDGPANGSLGSKCTPLCKWKTTDSGTCETCNPTAGLNQCDITTSCIWTPSKNQYFCACRAGYRADGLDPNSPKQFRLPFAGQEYRVFVAPGVVCGTLCTHPFPGPSSCQEVPVRADC